MKKPYNIDKWSERDLGWKPALHAQTIEEAAEKVARVKKKDPSSRVRVRHKDTGDIIFC